MTVSTPTNTGMYTGYAGNASFGTLHMGVEQYGLQVQVEEIGMSSVRVYIPGDGPYIPGQATVYAGHWETISDGEDTINQLNAFGLGLGVKESIIDGALLLNEGTNTAGLAKYMRISKTLGVVGSLVTTGYAANEVVNQYSKGGEDEVFKHRDILDATVGTVGLGATALAAFGIISNPVGWVIGAGVLIYGGATLIYDASND